MLLGENRKRQEWACSINTYPMIYSALYMERKAMVGVSVSEEDVASDVVKRIRAGDESARRLVIRGATVPEEERMVL